MSRSRLLFIFLSAVLSRMAFPWGLSCFQEAIAALNITASRQHTTALRRTFISPCYLLKIEGNLSQMLPPPPETSSFSLDRFVSHAHAYTNQGQGGMELSRSVRPIMAHSGEMGIEPTSSRAHRQGSVRKEKGRNG